MTIEETLEQAAKLFGISVAAITHGGGIKGGVITAAREWVVNQHPELGTGELMRALNYKSHASIILIRKKNLRTSRI